MFLGKMSYNVSHIYEVADFENGFFNYYKNFFSPQSLFLALNPPFYKYAVSGCFFKSILNKLQNDKI